jgi:trimeric autotransporter adhesin
MKILSTKNLLPAIICLSIFCNLLSCTRPETQQKENDKYDGAEAAQEFEFQRIKDPATGRIPQGALYEAMLQTRRARSMAINSPTAGPWTERGPNSDAAGISNGNTRPNNGVAAGRVRAIMVDSADATHKTIWVGGVDGGLWKTTDITASPAGWIPVNDFLSNLAIMDICQDPTDYNIMYFCTGEPYYNSDAVNGVGVFKSIDHGVTWNLLPSTSTYTKCSRILCDYQGNIYLATGQLGLFRSTKASGGAAWTNITPNGLNSRICDLEISSTSGPARLHVVAGIKSAQAYRYTDIPTTVTSAFGWNAPTTPFPSYTNRAEIDCNGSTLYALPADYNGDVPTIYKSTDGGNIWTATAGQPTGYMANGQGGYDLAVDIDPSNSNNCIVGGIDTWKTTDGGATWTKISTWYGYFGQYVHADVHKILWYDGGNKLLFGCDGGVHFSADKGTTIRDRNVGLRIKQFYSCAAHPASGSNVFLAGTQDNGTHQFTNAGLSSTTEVTGGDGGFVAIDQDQPQYQFASYVYNKYRRSTDGGTTWTIVDYLFTGLFINPYDYDNTNNLLYASNGVNSYLRWDNPQTGSTFTPVAVAANNNQISAVTVSPYSSNVIYLGSNDYNNGSYGGTCVLLKVANANTATPTITSIKAAAMPVSATVSCINTGASDAELIACFSNYGVSNVWVSTNSGTTWTTIDGNLPNMPVRWCMFYPGSTTKAIIATETGVWSTALINGASTVWTPDSGFPTVRTDMLKYRSSDGTLVAATHGRGLWTQDLLLIPVTLTSFEAAPINKDVVLNWQTSQEINSDHFEIERSSDGINFTSIGRMFAAGSSNSQRQYTFTDNHPNYLNYYRLKMVDKDGKFDYSKIVFVKFADDNIFQLGQNLVTSSLNVNISTTASNPAMITIYDFSGKEVIQLNAKQGLQSINVSRLASGKYIISLRTKEGQTYTRTFVKQ